MENRQLRSIPCEFQTRDDDDQMIIEGYFAVFDSVYQIWDDMSESISDHYNGAYYTTEQRELVKKHLAKMRDEEAKTGKSIRGAHELEVDAKGNVLTFDTMFPDKLPAEQSDNLKAMTVRDLLTMTCGHDEEPNSMRRDSIDWVEGFLSWPVKHKPGEYYLYNSVGTYMLSAIVQKVTGEKLLVRPADCVL